jgi:hypothetical protein
MASYPAPSGGEKAQPSEEVMAAFSGAAGEAEGSVLWKQLLSGSPADICPPDIALLSNVAACLRFQRAEADCEALPASLPALARRFFEALGCKDSHRRRLELMTPPHLPRVDRIAAEDPISAAKAALAAPFLMAAHFCGFRPGYVFRFGPTGLGYYADAMIANGTIAPPKAVAEELEPEPEGAAEPGRACESEPSTLRSDEATPVAEEVQTDVGLIKKGVCIRGPSVIMPPSFSFV